ncbi:solute carrier family 2, facilitated glucose transporter member 5-like [Biomphalaria glabrata]|uniref:Solute carrier family 2, facilitated glucose transporter member 5-like n=1 Tax=Biomphalaria glabrata TaxID=6526 RepID=A0A9W3A890_BIOGL|nr:solute carrier family 2, facilitated glucose transporter member 5-like [Biomphalaria glabrata]
MGGGMIRVPGVLPYFLDILVLVSILKPFFHFYFFGFMPGHDGNLQPARKGTLLLNNAVAFTCAALQGCSKVSNSFEVLIAGRVVAGICCGLNSAVAPLYLAKIAPISLRGFCGTCSQLSITFGVLIWGILGMKLVLGTETLWPILDASPTIPAIYSLVTLTFCPESPKYLLVNKRDDDAAEAALIWLRKTSDVSEEMEAMKKER